MFPTAFSLPGRISAFTPVSSCIFLVSVPYENRKPFEFPLQRAPTTTLPFTRVSITLASSKSSSIAQVSVFVPGGTRTTSSVQVAKTPIIGVS